MSSKCIRDTVNKVKSKYQESDPFRLAAAMHILCSENAHGKFSNLLQRILHDRKPKNLYRHQL